MKNIIKKLSMAIITVAILASSFTTLAASQFSDLAEEHWAHRAVSILVSEGTINGYPDGTFRPTDTVTRAQFVKMLGMGTESGKTYADVAEGHWAYDYISTSELDGDDAGNFNPDRAITREETVYPLYARSDKPETNAPEFIAEQGGEPLAWVYEYGIMIGNDGLNLRLEDTLTRAEAAALIIKAREAKTPFNFVDTVSEGILEYVYNSINIFDTPYSKDKTITYGELSRATLRMEQNRKNVDYTYYNAVKPFNNDYAVDLYIIGNRVLGSDKISESVINKNATIRDAISCFDSVIKERTGKKADTDIKLYTKGTEYLSGEVTHRELAAMIIQYDEAYGLLSGYYPGLDKNGRSICENNKMVKSFDMLPANYKDYVYVIDGIPEEVYKFDGNVRVYPKETTDFASTIADIFATRCGALKNAMKSEYGIDADVVFYPGLTYDNAEGFVNTIKIVIKENGGTVTKVSDLFTSNVLSCSTGDKLKNGTVMYLRMYVTYNSLV